MLSFITLVHNLIYNKKEMFLLRKLNKRLPFLCINKNKYSYSIIRIGVIIYE